MSTPVSSSLSFPVHGGAVPVAAVAFGLLLLGAATLGVVSGIEPFATWYYLFAWYPTLLTLDGVVALRARRRRGAPPAAASDGPLAAGEFLLLGRPAHLATLLGWSAVTWLFFELLNFRLRNWYYVFVPDEPLARWAGVTLSFATVLPAVFVAEAALASWGVAREMRWPRLRVTRGLLAGIRVAGALALVLPLLWPGLFFPLVWGAALFSLEPLNYRRDPGRSLLGDLERGRPGRILRLLLAGALVGLLWELYNVGARGKWIYTVPGLEELKLFEMPLLGFLGFPPFALECFAIWQALVLCGLAVPRVGAPRRVPAVRRAAAAVGALAFGAAVLAGMEVHTISSMTPRLRDLPGVPAGVLQRAGYDVLSLAGARPDEVAAVLGRASNPGPDFGSAKRTAGPAAHREPPELRDARRWISSARLAALRGIGTENARRLMAAGVRSVGDLAASDPEDLTRRLAAISGKEIVASRVRVWVRAAREEVPAGESSRAALPVDHAGVLVYPRTPL